MGRLRDAWNALRGYAAAQDHRASAWAPSGGSANAEVGMAAATVARRARDAVRNDPYASRIVDLWTGNAVGAGITTRWPDDARGRAWQRWAESTACDAEGRLDLYGMQALVMRAVVESGECFVRFLMTAPSAANPIGLRLQVLECDHLDASHNGMVDGAATIQGIALGGERPGGDPRREGGEAVEGDRRRLPRPMGLAGDGGTSRKRKKHSPLSTTARITSACSP